MRFIEVKEIPEKGDQMPTVQYHKLNKELEEFIRMNVKYVKIIFGENEYKSFKTARVSLRAAIRYHGLPIKMINRSDTIYLMRTDI